MANKRAGVQEADMLFVQNTEIDLTGVAADSLAFVPGAATVLIQWGWNVMTTLACDTIAPIVTIDIADYAGANRVEIGTYTFVDATVAANAVTWQDFPTHVSDGYPLPEGWQVIIEHQIAATDTGAAAGGCRVFVVYRMTGQ